MSNPLLSICIPTYSRAHYLKQQLDNIVGQFNNQKIYNQVEIIISDNASLDKTKEIVKNYQEKFSNIFYYKNETNLGFDRNVESVIRHASGDFIWTLSDDDFINENSLDYILEIIKKYPEVALVCIDNSLLGQFTMPILYGNGNEWLTGQGIAGGMISQNIFNRKYLLHDVSKYYDNYWLHYAIAREISVDKPTLFVKNIFKIPEPDHRCDWAVNGTPFFTYINLKIIVANLVSFGYDSKIISKLIKDFAKHLAPMVAVAKICGLTISWSNFKFLVKQFYRYPFYLLIAIVVFLTPTRILKLIRPLWRALKKMKK